MICPNCNHDNPEGSKFCEECGTKLPEPKKRCPSCGSELNGTPKFCPECGFKLSETTASKTAGVSVGDKNVVAGDLNVIGKKEEYNVSGNATIIKHEDDTKKVETCPICGKSYFRINGRQCKSCGRYVCSDCFDAEHHVCADCRKRDVEEAESKYRQVLEDVLADGRIDKEEAIRLNALRGKLGISNTRAKELESDAKAKRTQDILSSIDEISLEKATTLFINGKESEAFEIANGLYSHHPGNDKVLRIYYLSGAVCRSKVVLEKAKSVEYDSPLKYISLFLYYFHSEDYPMADKVIQKALMLWPENTIVKCCEVMLLREVIEKSFNRKLAEEIIVKIKRIPNKSDDSIENYFIRHARKTYVEEADRLLLSENASIDRVFINEWFFFAFLERENIHRYLNIDEESKAFHLYEKSAETGCGVALFRMAVCFAIGCGIEQEPSVAIKYFNAASDEGSVEAQVCLGLCYEKGFGIECNQDKAVGIYKVAEKKENAFAKYKLGQCLICGNGIEKDESAAFEYLESAARSGIKEAQLLVADCYMHGIGTDKNEKKALDLYISIAESGVLEAIRLVVRCFSEGIGTERDESKAFQWNCRLAEMGDTEAQKRVAYGYMNGIGIQKDDQKAFICYQKVAEKGDVESETIVAKCYNDGTGVEIDKTKAFLWYSKVAEKDYPDAQEFIAGCYMEGIGVDRNGAKAFEWYLKAANHGKPISQYYVGFCYSEGIGIEKNGEKAFEWFIQSAEQGFPQAQCKVGDYFWKGINISPDRKKALYWYYQSAKQGNPQGQYYMYRCSPSVNKNEKWLHMAAENGYASAQYELANYYYENDDLGSAEKWLRLYFQTVLKAAENGDTDAQLKTGLCYRFGRGVEPNEEKAHKWISKVAEKWIPEAHWVLLFHSSMFDETLDYYSSNFKWDSEIPFLCSELNEYAFGRFTIGDGLQIDDKGKKLLNEYRLSLKDIRREWMDEYYNRLINAANHNDTYAQRLLGDCINHKILDENRCPAYQWYLKAAEGGDLEAAYTVGKYLIKNGDINKGLEYLINALSSDDLLDDFMDDACLLGLIEDWNLNNLREDINKDLIFKLIKKNAEIHRWSYFACRLLSEAYLIGCGTEINREEALKWAFRSGSRDIDKIVDLLSKGNDEEQRMAFRIADKYDKNNEDDFFNLFLGNCYEFGQGTNIDEDKAFDCYNEYFKNHYKMNSMRDIIDATALGRCYEYGVGTEIDITKASEIYMSILDDIPEKRWDYTFIHIIIAVLRFRMGCLFQKKLITLDKIDRKKRKICEKQSASWFKMAEDMGYEDVFDKQFHNNFNDLDVILTNHPDYSFQYVLKYLKEL